MYWATSLIDIAYLILQVFEFVQQSFFQGKWEEKVAEYHVLDISGWGRRCQEGKKEMHISSFETIILAKISTTNHLWPKITQSLQGWLHKKIALKAPS